MRTRKIKRTFFTQINTIIDWDKSEEGVSIGYKDCKVLQLDFMLYTDKKYGDKKPSKTYGGPTYYGGYSDHLLILTRFK